jgi:signal transduction histidine kinase
VFKIEKSKEEAELADKAKTEFLSNMSHEIRTPLNTIMGFSESLLNEKSLTEDVVKRDTKSIHDASISLLDLINNILDISRIESGKESVEEKNYMLQNLVFEINSVISSKINKELLEFEIT